MDEIWLRIREGRAAAADWLMSPAFYVQLALIAGAIALAFSLGWVIRSRMAEVNTKPQGESRVVLRRFLVRLRALVVPILTVVLLGVAGDAGRALERPVWLIQIAQSLAVVVLLYNIIARFIGDWVITAMLKWIGIPVATLHVFGWLDEATAYLDTFSIRVGNLQLSIYDVGRTVFFGVILFWLGRISNQTGTRAIRSNPRLDVGTREVAVKLFEIALFMVIAFILLNIMGVSLTALTVFGGAVGIGLGLGLQNIAANFISGIIILLDRSITIGDYIELSSGQAGRLRELNMRFATLETYDGRDIVVPNETFVSEAFVNWTHHDNKQRYAIEFSVGYDTDLDFALPLFRDTIASHPQVLSGPDYTDDEQPDSEIKEFGDSGIVIECEFWMVGIDDGPNRVRADLYLMIWTVCREHGIVMPFPQREVKILNGNGTGPTLSAG
jgi:small-conductance mechanosensitive channel